MKRRNTILSFIPIFIIPLLSGCNGPSKADVLLNGFETIEDLYKFKTSNVQYENILSYDLNSDKNYISQGEKSLKVSISSGSVEELMFPFSYKGSDLFDISKLSVVKLDIFNVSENDLTMDLNIYNSKTFNILLTSSYTLKSHELTNIEYNVSAIAVKNNYETIKGVQLRFANENVNSVFYLDNLRVGLGNKMSEEDKKYEKIISTLEKDISALPADITINNYDELENVYKRYVELPTLYRNIVSNYDELFKKIQSLVEIMNSSSESTALIKDAFSFDKFYGVGEFYNHETVGGNLKYYYQNEVRYQDEDGALEINFFGNIWNYIGYTLPSDIADFDYIEFHFYNFDENNSNQTKRVYFGWSGNWVNCPANEWVSVQVKPETLLNSTYGIIINQFDNNGVTLNSSGKLYVGKALAYRTKYKKIGLALNKENPFVTDGNINISISGNNIDISSAISQDVTLKLNKDLSNLSKNEYFITNIIANEQLNIDLVNENDEVFSSIGLNKGSNSFLLNSEEYNQLSSLKIKNMKSSSSLSFASPLIYKNDYIDLAKTYIRLQSLLSDYSLKEVSKLITFFSSFYSLSKEDKTSLNEFDSESFKNIEYVENQLTNSSLIDDYVNNALNNNKDELSPLLISLNNNDFVKKYCTNVTLGKLEFASKYYDICYGNKKTIKTGIDYQWEGSVSSDFDLEMGNVYTANINKMLFENYLQFEFESMSTSQYSTLTLFIYNPLDKDVSGNYFNVNALSGQWENVTNLSLAKKSWTKVVLPASSVTGSRSFIMLMGDVTSQGWKISNVYGMKSTKEVEGIVAKINNLPDNVSSEQEKMQVLSIYNDYDKLNENVKKSVNNSQKLISLYSSITSLELAKTFELSSFTYLDSISSDFSHGDLFAGEISAKSENPANVFVLRNADVLKLNEYKEIVFYIYVNKDVESAFLLRQYSVDWSGFNTSLSVGFNRISVKIDEWFNSSSDKTGDLYFYMYSSSESALMGITHFYGVK